MQNDPVWTLSIFLVLAILFAALWLSAKTAILCDASRQVHKPYSFARTQLMWWTLIISTTYALQYGWNKEFVELGPTALTLLGISIGTTLAGRVIDKQDLSEGIPRHQDYIPSRSFLTDILSDENGISIHRFQALVFNIIFGVGFLSQFFYNFKKGDFTFPDFGLEALTLMGISSSAYVALKMKENQPKTGGAPATAQTSDDELMQIPDNWEEEIVQG